MRILFIGDIFGAIGRRVLAENLDDIKDEFSINITVANGENCAGGRGITGNIMGKLLKYGIDIVTGGNHSLADTDIYCDPKYAKLALRPLNLSSVKKPLPGIGKTVFETETGLKLGVINLHGQTFMNGDIDSAFTTATAAIESIKKVTNNIFIDIHAEATSEKICLAHYLDGKVSAIVGTHTHVQTADERLLSNGTAFITDVGMTGPEDSAIGMKPEAIIAKYLKQGHQRFEPAKKGPMLNAVVIDIDETLGKAKSIKRIFRRYNFAT